MAPPAPVMTATWPSSGSRTRAELGEFQRPIFAIEHVGRRNRGEAPDRLGFGDRLGRGLRQIGGNRRILGGGAEAEQAEAGHQRDARRGIVHRSALGARFVADERIADVAPTALIDLAKPSFKMGVARAPRRLVGARARRQGDAGETTYKVRDKASVAISVRRHDGSAPPAGSDVAFAAVDEGLLELLPNDSWKLLDAMMTRRGEQVETSTAQSR